MNEADKERLHQNILINTDYSSHDEAEVYIELTNHDPHQNFLAQVYLYEWLSSNGVEFEVFQHDNDEIRLTIESREHRTMMRLAFTFIKERPHDPMWSLRRMNSRSTGC